jgi:hypothetical protein
MEKFVWISFFIFCFAIGSIVTQSCDVNINEDLAEIQPLYLYPKEDNFYFPYGNDGWLSFGHGQGLRLHCEHGFKSSLGISVKTITVTCKSGTQFTYNSRDFELKNFECQKLQKPEAKKDPIGCYKGADYVNIGYKVGNGFVEVYSVCHNPNTEENLFLKHEIHSFSLGGANNRFRTDWPSREPLSNYFKGKEMNELYTRAKQLETLTNILGSQKLAESVIQLSGGQTYFARGHLVANSDFSLVHEQQSTFTYLNAAPQFQSFNNGNWKALEIKIREVAATNLVGFEVYTGTYGVMEFPDVKNNLQQIYLEYNTVTKIKSIPVPKIFYKILFHQDKINGKTVAEGVVFIGVNNIHIKTKQDLITNGYIICNEVQSQVKFIDVTKLTKLSSGYMYACEISDFLRKVPHVSSKINANQSIKLMT